MEPRVPHVTSYARAPSSLLFLRSARYPQMPRFLQFLREFWPMPLPLMIHSALALFAQRTRIPTSARSIGFCVIWVCISSSSSSSSAATSTNAKSYVGPAVNYIMLHVGMGPGAHGLRSFGESRGVKTFVYGALGEPGPSSELIGQSSGTQSLPSQSDGSRKSSTPPSVTEILARAGASHGSRTSEEVALRWALQIGCAALSVRPTSSFGLGSNICPPGGDACMKGLQKRSRLFDWALTEKEMAEISALSSPDGNPTLFSSPGCPGAWGTI